MYEGGYFGYVEVQGREENLVPWAHIHLLCRLKELRIYPGENFYSRRACTTQQCAPWPWWWWWHECRVIISLQTFGSTTQDSLSARAVPLPSRSTAHQLSCDGSACGVQLQPHNRMAPESINPRYFPAVLPVTGYFGPNLYQPASHGSVKPAGLSKEECPLVVGPPSHPSRVVVGERMPTVTVLSSAAETTLSSLPNMAPRISTSSSNVTGEDVRRVIWQYPTSSPNRVLAGVGAGRGSTRRPTKCSASRGQGLAGVLTESVSSIGRGRSTPLPPIGRSQQGKRQASSCIESDHPPMVQCNWTAKALWLHIQRPPPGHPREL